MLRKSPQDNPTDPIVSNDSSETNLWKKRGLKALRFLKRSALLGILIFLASPIWIPWTIPVAAGWLGVEIKGWSYKGLQRIELQEVTFSNSTFTLEVENVSIPQLTDLIFLKALHPSDFASLVEVKDWQLEIHSLEDTSPPEFNSPLEVLDFLETLKSYLIPLNPKFRLVDGAFTFESETLKIPILRGSLSEIETQISYEKLQLHTRTQLKWPDNSKTPSANLAVTTHIHTPLGWMNQEVVIRSTQPSSDSLQEQSLELSGVGNWMESEWDFSSTWSSQNWIPSQGAFRFPESTILLKRLESWTSLIKFALTLSDLPPLPPAPTITFTPEVSLIWEQERLAWDFSMKISQPNSDSSSQIVKDQAPLELHSQGVASVDEIDLETLTLKAPGISLNLQEPGAKLSLTSYRLAGSTKADVSLQYEDFLGWMDPWVSYLESIPIPALPLDQLKRFKGNFAATLDVGQSSPSEPLPEISAVARGSELSFDNTSIPAWRLTASWKNDHPIAIQSDFMDPDEPTTALQSTKMEVDPIQMQILSLNAEASIPSRIFAPWIPSQSGIKIGSLDLKLNLKNPVGLELKEISTQGQVTVEFLQAPPLREIKDISLKWDSTSDGPSNNGRLFASHFWNFGFHSEAGEMLSNGAIQLTSEQNILEAQINELQWTPSSADLANISNSPTIKLESQSNWQFDLDDLILQGNLALTATAPENDSRPQGASSSPSRIALQIDPFNWPDVGDLKIQIERWKPSWLLGWVEPESIPGPVPQPLLDTQISKLDVNISWDQAPMNHSFFLSVNVPWALPGGTKSNLAENENSNWNVLIQTSGGSQGQRLENFSVKSSERQWLAASGLAPWSMQLNNSSGFDFHKVSGTQTQLAFRIEPIHAKEFQPILPPFLRPEGSFQGQGTWSGQSGWNGSIEFSDWSTEPMGLLNPVKKISGKALLAGTKVQIDSIQATIGDRELKVKGWVDAEPTLKHLEGLEDFSVIQLNKIPLPVWDLGITATNLTLVSQPGKTLRASLSIKTSHVSGSTPLTEGRIYMDPSIFITDVQSLLKQGPTQNMPRPPFFRLQHPLISDWRLKLNVTGEDFMRIRSPVFQGSASVAMNVSGTLGDPVLIGDVIVPEGTIKFPFGKLKIQQGLVTLSQTNPTQPIVYVVAGSRVFGYQIQMEVSGPAENPVAIFTSNPPLSSQSILLMLTAGQLPKNELSYSSAKKAGALALYSGKSLIDRWSLEEPGDSRLTFESGEGVSNNGRVTYQVEYELSDRFFLTGEYDEYDAINAGVKYKLLDR